MYGTIILDRDGVLNEVRKDYVKAVEELIIIKESINDDKRNSMINNFVNSE